MRNLCLILLIAVVLITSCSQDNQGKNQQDYSHLKDRKKPMSWGHQQKIYVFADADIWKYAENKLRGTIERTFYTTVNEKIFELERVDFDKLEDYFRFNNIIFYCDTSSNEPVSDYVKEILGKKVKDEVSANGAALFPAFNLWADDQMVLFITGEDAESTLKLNILQADKIYEVFRDRLYKRIRYKLYKRRIKPESNYADKIWTIELPASYMKYREDTANNFTSYIARSNKQPDKYMAIYYENMETNQLNRKWLIDKRNQLTGIYYEGDHITEMDIMSANVEIAGYEGIKITGRWQNDNFAIGGAFTSFAFYVPEKKQAFILDNSVYYPEGEKLPALIELEIIADSFKIKL